MKEALALCAVWGLAAATIYHEGSKTILSQDSDSAKLFGYSVMLREGTPPRLIVGDPTNSPISRSVFTCPIDFTSPEVDCEPLAYEIGTDTRKYPYMQDALAGASIANIDGSLAIICAPSWGRLALEPLESGATKTIRLVSGLCYSYDFTEESSSIFYPASNEASGNVSFVPDHNTTKYASTAETINYFAYAQTGFSASVSPDRRWLLLGAPGLLDWTGGVINYDLTAATDSQSNLKFNNPFYTEQLGPNAYFGYSVNAGVFVPGEETLGVGGAPRGNNGLGEVFVFGLEGEESDPLNVHAHLPGSQLGEYFGSAVLVVDINADGRADLLVGAPHHVHFSKDQQAYDQGIVYVYMNRQAEKDSISNHSGFKLELVDKLMGSGASGANFGYSIADLGDLDGDGFSDVAIGAPWEGPGVVYIYRGHPDGIQRVYTQKISGSDYLKGFGFSISRGLDLDNNSCNELAVGAIMSVTSVVLRCVPTIVVQGSIRILNATNSGVISTADGDPKVFTAQFCVIISPFKIYGNATIDMVANILIDHGNKKQSDAVLIGDNEFRISAKSEQICEERLIQPSSDRPIDLMFILKPVYEVNMSDKDFPTNYTRIGEDSTLISNLKVRFAVNCGDDLICQPDLRVTFTPLSRLVSHSSCVLELSYDIRCSLPFIPGSGERLGVEVRIVNRGESAYNACMTIYLPASPLNVPSNCSLKGMEVRTTFPRLFFEDEAKFKIELEQSSNMTNQDLTFIARLYNSCVENNNSDSIYVVNVEPRANITVKGRSLPKGIVEVSESQLEVNTQLDFAHAYEIFNHGPSDWPAEVHFNIIAVGLELVDEVPGCSSDRRSMTCRWNLDAHKKRIVHLHLRIGLQDYEDRLKRNEKLHFTTHAHMLHGNKTVEVSSWVALKPAPELVWWPILVAVLVGLLLVAAIVYVLYKVGFFARSEKEDLQKLREEPPNKQYYNENCELPTASDRTELSAL